MTLRFRMLSKITNDGQWKAINHLSAETDLVPSIEKPMLFETISTDMFILCEVPMLTSFHKPAFQFQRLF